MSRMMYPSQEVVTLALSPSIREKLLIAGFRTVRDFGHIQPVQLAKEAGITTDDAFEVLKVISPPGSVGLAGAKSAQELYVQQKDAKRITTCCAELDGVLGGGVATGHICEFCGVPGVGKTQLGIQLCCSVQVPAASGGLGGAAVYVDTEGSFTTDRAYDMALAICQQQQQQAGGQQGAAGAGSPEALLENIYYFRIHDYTEQLALVQMLPAFLQQHPAVRLVVVDSVTFHFRHDFRDMMQRSRVLSQMAQDLMQLAEGRDIAVVFMNQVTTKVVEGQAAKLVPALGESWGHAASTRVILHWEGAQRQALVYKSPSQPPATAPYTVTLAGIRSVYAAPSPTASHPPAPGLPSNAPAPRPMAARASEPQKRGPGEQHHMQAHQPPQKQYRP